MNYFLVQILRVFTCILLFQVSVTQCWQEQLSSGSEHIMGVIVGRVDTKVGVFRVDGKKLSLLKELVVETSTIPDFTIFLKQVLSAEEEEHGVVITRACIGAPGPSSENYDIMRPYFISFVLNAQEIKEQTSLKQVKIINDFEVIGFGLEYLDEACIIPINAKLHQVPSSALAMVWDLR